EGNDLPPAQRVRAGRLVRPARDPDAHLAEGPARRAPLGRLPRGGPKARHEGLPEGGHHARLHAPARALGAVRRGCAPRRAPATEHRYPGPCGLRGLTAPEPSRPRTHLDWVLPRREGIVSENESVTSSTAPQQGTALVKRGMAEMLKGGVIMDVVTPEQAKIAEDAGAVAVMALERVPADIRAQGGVSRMSDPDMIAGIIDAVSIPVMAKARIGHFVEAQVLQALGVDYVDESEVLTPADYEHHIDKWAFTVPFVCG